MRNSDEYDHLVSFNTERRFIVIHRIQSDGQRTLYTEISFDDALRHGLDEFSKLLGENIIFDSKIGRSLFPLEGSSVQPKKHSSGKLRRKLQLDEGTRQSQVIVEIEYPEKHGSEFGCRVIIKGHKQLNFDNKIFGVDSMQAMALALRFVQSIITDHELYRSGKLYWLEPGNNFDPF